MLDRTALTVVKFSVGFRNLCELLNLVKELIGFECLKKSGVISRCRFKAQNATNKTRKHS